jgi:hypothetical protein
MNATENKTSTPVDIELVSEEIPVEAEIVHQSIGSIGKPLTPEQMIREEKEKIRKLEKTIADRLERNKETRMKIRKAKERIRLYEKAIAIQ